MGYKIENLIVAADVEAQYDLQAKSLLGNKSILARILVQTVDEFLGMNPEIVESLIEGTPMVGNIPVDSGMTNVAIIESGSRITGMNTENYEIHEGMIRFDILFHVSTPDGSSRLIIDVEAQKDEPGGYAIMNRSNYYSGRLLSAQKDREFSNSNYNDIKRVFSIWICMNKERCILNQLFMADEKVVGNYQWEGKQKIMNIVLIGLPKQVPNLEEGFSLHRMLGVLFSVDMSPKEKLKILEEEYHIVAKDEFEEEMAKMCNLSQGVLEIGIERGIEAGKKYERKQMLEKLKKLGISKDILSAMEEMEEEELQKEVEL